MSFKVTTTLRARRAEKWIRAVKRDYLDNAPIKCVGLDYEFTNPCEGDQRAAVLQLSLASENLVFHIWDEVPQVLKEFLQDGNNRFCGATIGKDVEMLSPYGIHITSAYDLQKILPNPTNNHIQSLYDLANSIIGTNLEKKKRKKYKKKDAATCPGDAPRRNTVHRPPLPFALVAPSCVAHRVRVYKVGGDPGDCQFLYEPPKEIPHGYVCTYVPDCNSLARTNQIAPAGISGADADKQAWLAKYATGTSHESSVPAAHTVEQISTILRDQFGILPKRKTIGYSKPYPDEYDLIPLPPKYRLPEFSKFNGSEGSSSIEHVSRYLAQLGMISASDPLRVRFFAQSLTGSAFGWYTSLPPNSVRTWKQLEEQFHVQYHSEATEAGIADLAQVRPRRGETVSEYIQCFRTVKNRCYSARLNEKEAVELTVLGLAAPIKDLAFQVDYSSLAHMVQKLTLYEQRHPELYQDKFKRPIGLVETEEVEDSPGDQEVAVAEWTRGAVPVSCKWVKPQGPPKGFDFDGLYTTMAKIKKKAVIPVARKRRRPAHVTGPDMMTDGMSRLPTIDNCPECRQQKKDAGEVSVFKRLGPLPPQNKRAESSQDEDFEESEDEEEDRYHRPRWCPDGLSHSP
ncbi:hypothetical protein QYE76_034200 [Lolium multiflorum]|uniref:Retrotransposon gag domain-containing protein n=1 Tax=Lolium multiflorum TaxID=4521 RepID=A0AAD8QYP8_LOLMU|nr:hypothetical protein QYE76_034200 [Lolium multiflorum]